MKHKITAILKNGGILLLLIPIMLYFLLQGADHAAMRAALRSVHLGWLGAAAMCMALFMICEGINIGHCLKLSGYRVTWSEKVKYACVGFFFSSITPSATGGQPMQIAYMKKDGYPLSEDLISLMAILMNYQAVTTGFAILGMLAYGSEMKSISAWLILGIALNAVVFLLLLAISFSNRIRTFLCALLGWLSKVLKAKHGKWLASIEQTMEQVRQGTRCLFRSKRCLALVFLTTCMQILVFNSIPYFVYRSFGLHAAGWWQMFCLQSVLYVSISSLPLPGAVGANEGGAWILFGAFYPEAMVQTAILLTRFISFYAPLILSGAFLGGQAIVRRSHSHKTE